MISRRYERIVATLTRRQPDLTVAMENVHKTRNLGALARTCDAVGIGVIHAVTRDDFSTVLGHKTAGGTEKWISVQSHPTIADAYAEFRKRGFTLLAADVGPDTVDFRDIDLLSRLSSFSAPNWMACRARHPRPRTAGPTFL